MLPGDATIRQTPITHRTAAGPGCIGNKSNSAELIYESFRVHAAQHIQDDNLVKHKKYINSQNVLAMAERPRHKGFNGTPAERNGKMAKVTIHEVRAYTAPGYPPCTEFMVYVGERLIRTCPSRGMAEEVAAGAA